MDRFLIFLKGLPSIYLVFFCFLLLLPIYLTTRSTDVFGLLSLALGSILTLAKEFFRPQPATGANVANIENAELHVAQTTGDASGGAAKRSQ